MKAITFTLASFACTLLIHSPAAAAVTPPATLHQTAKAKSEAVRSAWPPETLSGKIIMVNPNRNLVVVQSPNGVPFDMVVTSKTHIRAGDKTLTMHELGQYQNRDVSLRFVPESRGDVAQSIRIGG